MYNDTRRFANLAHLEPHNDKGKPIPQLDRDLAQLLYNISEREPKAAIIVLSDKGQERSYAATTFPLLCIIDVGECGSCIGSLTNGSKFLFIFKRND